jgi:high-affinity iron transporter
VTAVVYLNLFLRTFSQALQAFMPIALSLTWFERTGATSTSSAIHRGLILSIPATVVGSWLFQHSNHRALDEALLATIAVAVTSVFAWRVWNVASRGKDPDRAITWAVTTLAALIVVRQTTEIGSALEIAAIELRLFSPTVTILSALMIGGCIAWAMRRIGLRLPAREMTSATRAFVVIFFVQGVIYAFHELTEARLLPASDILHPATEAYGPDGIYGVHLSDLLVVAPLVAAAMTFIRSNRLFSERIRFVSRPGLPVPWLGIAFLALIGLQGTDPGPRRDDSTVSEADIAT